MREQSVAGAVTELLISPSIAIAADSLPDGGTRSIARAKDMSARNDTGGSISIVENAGAASATYFLALVAML
jgi:hypothetical protein